MPFRYLRRGFAHGQLLALAAAVATAVLSFSSAAIADDNDRGKGEARADRALRLIGLAPIPASSANNTAGGLYSFDISFVDQSTDTYYLADRSNAVVDVVN